MKLTDEQVEYCNYVMQSIPRWHGEKVVAGMFLRLNTPEPTMVVEDKLKSCEAALAKSRENEIKLGNKLFELKRLRNEVIALAVELEQEGFHNVPAKLRDLVSQKEGGMSLGPDVCPYCKAERQVSPYLAAHWDDTLTATCGTCNKQYILRRGISLKISQPKRKESTNDK